MAQGYWRQFVVLVGARNQIWHPLHARFVTANAFERQMRDLCEWRADIDGIVDAGDNYYNVSRMS